MRGRRKVVLHPDGWVVKPVGRFGREVRQIVNLRGDDVSLTSVFDEVDDPPLPGKAAKECLCRPYRKRTHVGEERILRRLSKLWLRNSAN